MKNKTKKFCKGSTLIESLVLVLVVSIAVMTFYKTYTLAMRYAIDTKHRTAAVAFATEKLEILRNTPYEDVLLDPATNPPTGNVISGSAGVGLSYDVLRNINDVPHRILTEVYYVDDAEDGTGASDNEQNDYKKVIITVLWGAGIIDSTKSSHKITLSSFFVPPSGNESAIVNGALSVNVVNSDGVAVQDANVRITYTNGGNVSGYTDPVATSNIGNALFLNLTKNTYKITVTKTNYETIETMTTTLSFIPMYPHASVLPGVITTLTIVMDTEPNVTSYVRDPFGDEVSDVEISLTGGRVSGVDGSGNSVYVNTNISATSDINGEITHNSLSGYTPSVGTYWFQLVDTGYVLWKERDAGVCASYDSCGVCVVDPLEVRDQFLHTAEVVSGTFDSDLIVVSKDVFGVMVTVADELTGDPFEGATVRLVNGDPAYDYTRTTDQYGVAYFPVKNKADGTEGTACDIVSLTENESYDITIAADGYDTHTETVTVEDVSGNKLKNVNVTLNVTN